MALLEPAALETLERLALATRTRLLGALAGDHRSRRYGSSVDFADYREYKPGDDFRRIDVHLSARHDRLFLKLFEAEEDVPVRLVVDCSASMGFGTPAKLGFAARAAAALAHVGLMQGDRVRLYAARDGGAEPSRWFRGKGDSPAVMTWLEQLDARGTAGAARAIHEEGRPGVLVLLSDLLEDDWEQTVRRLAPPGEAGVVQVLAPEEMEPPLEGDLTLVDAETGSEMEISVTAASLQAYRRRRDAWLGAVRSACTSRGIGYALAGSDADIIQVFIRELAARRVMVR